VAVAREVFDAHMPAPNQIDVKREDVRVAAADLLSVPGGTRTEAGLRHNVRVGVQYLESWLRGAGCVPLYDLMEDAATAEICRTQVWQWLHHGAALEDGRPLTVETFRRILDQEMDKIAHGLGDGHFYAGRFGEARVLFERLCTSASLEDFLTVPAYESLISRPARRAPAAYRAPEEMTWPPL
jgi:malate synthase